jgi:hypothetical protein
MKNVNILIIALLFSAISLQAATLVVNNSTPSVVGEYTTVQAAITAAANDDVILIKGTGILYGSFTVSKPLTIVGNGHKPATVSTFATRCASISLANGVQNVKLLGLHCNDIYAPGGNVDITVEFCKVENNIYLSQYGNYNWNITNCIFPAVDSYIRGENVSNIMIEHCYMAGPIQLFSGSTSIIIQYNVFASPNGFPAFGEMTSAVIKNNIFYESKLIGSNPYRGWVAYYTSCAFENNLTYNAAGNNDLPPNTGGNTITFANNVLNTNPNFVSFTLAAYNSAMNLNLQAGSAALTAGVPETSGGAGTQIGLYGNSFNFSTTGEPRIPAVRTISIINSSTNSGPASSLKVNITASKARPN